MKQWICVVSVVFLLAGCVWSNTNQTTSSSLVDFLYADSDSYVKHQPEVPTLKLPINVGVAFVPPNRGNALSLSAKKKHEILSTVKKEFLSLEYINRIEIISDNYLKSRGGFDTLNQVARLYDVEVMALVSYDQVVTTTDNKASIFYWTIAGMYLIPGNENITQTFVDTAVFDVRSQKMLFRAPGVSKVETLSTAVNLDQTTYENSSKGFDMAVLDMLVNLNDELNNFKVRVNEERIAKVENREGYRGGSSGIGLLLVLALCFFRAGRR